MKARSNQSTALHKPSSAQQMVLEDLFVMAEAATPPGLDAVLPNTAAPVAAATKTTIHVTRDTFSMPSGDYELIEQLRVRAAREGRNTNKSEVIRAGLRSLIALEPTRLVDILQGLEKVKPGRK